MKKIKSFVEFLKEKLYDYGNVIQEEDLDDILAEYGKREADQE